MRNIFKQQILFIIIVTGICIFTLMSVSLRPTHAAPANATITSTPVAKLRAPRALTPTATGIPTTSNPTINTANGAGRVFSNVSFESFSECPSAPTSYHVINMNNMFGWKTTAPVTSGAEQDRCNGINNGLYSRGVELQGVNLYGYTPDNGNVYAELNAYYPSFLYQAVCVANSDTIEFKFSHRAVGNSRTDITEFRIGIPTGLIAGSVASDSYSYQILRASSSSAANGQVNSAVQTTYTGTTANTATISTNKWGVYSGSYALPKTGIAGVRNIGFAAIQGASNTGGNALDNITVGIAPFIDMGTSRDRTAIEGSSPTALNIRINGRVTANTKIALRRNPLNPGPAVSDSDFTIGTISAGSFGNTTFTHTTGSDVWLISVPAGDYDGGIIPANNKGGLTINTYAN